MFRGCLKRIDYVLAFSDEKDTLWADEFKLAFMTTLVKIGLDLEIERSTVRYFKSNINIFLKLLTIFKFI